MLLIKGGMSTFYPSVPVSHDSMHNTRALKMKRLNGIQSTISSGDSRVLQGRSHYVDVFHNLSVHIHKDTEGTALMSNRGHYILIFFHPSTPHLCHCPGVYSHQSVLG